MREVKRHVRDNYYVVGEGILSSNGYEGHCERPSTEAELRKFRFSRIGDKGTPIDRAVLQKVAEAMTLPPSAESPVQPVSADPAVDAGFTYLGQFVDHDLTQDRTAAALGEHVTVNELLQGRSPALDLDSVYGRGPQDAADDRFYAPDGFRFKVGITAAINGPGTNVNLNGYDLPRVTQGSKKADRQAALIPDHRNDENLAVAQTHLAFLHFHNRVVDRLADRGEPSSSMFATAKDQVVRHYQWMLKTDYLPQIVDQAIIDDVFTNGRRFFEIPAQEENHNGYHYLKPGDHPTMPIEFSIAAFRLGHSMVRAAYDWNRVFADGAGTLEFLFRFSGTSGGFSPFGDINDQEAGLFERLPTNWTVDWRRMFDFTKADRPDLAAPNGVNVASRIDTLVVNPLAELPHKSIGDLPAGIPAIELNLAFRNLIRGTMLELASGQQMAAAMGLDALKPEEILTGAGGAVLDALTDDEKTAFVNNTPLWFYTLREAELHSGRLTGVGGRLVAEVFHRAMEGSDISIVREPSWRPHLGPDSETFRMIDLLLVAFDGKKELLAPLGDA